MTARGAAARLVRGVIDDRVPLSDQVQGGTLAALPPAERARAQRLALATLRNLARADAILKPILRKPPPGPIRAILRVAVTELLAEGAAPHGVVGDAVTETRALGGRSEAFTGLANAVLRRVSETPRETWDALPPPELPGWLRGRLMSAYGKRAVQAMEAAHARGAPLNLTPKDGDGAALAARLGGDLLPTGSVRLRSGVQVTDLPGYEAGEWWV